MKRFIHPVLAAVVAVLVAVPALASDQGDWSLGVASIGITSATSSFNVAVRNISPSTDADERELYVVSAPPDYSLSGQVFCKPILGGTTRLVSSQLLFGNALLQTTAEGTTILDWGVWDESAPIVYGGNIESANAHFDHAIDLPPTWNGGIELGFNPVKVVEDRLADYVDGGGSAVDFLRTDDVFEVQIAVNLAGTCQNTSDYGVKLYSGYTRRWITARVFYEGDPNLHEQPAITLPDQIQAPSLPPQLYVYAPIARSGRGDGTSDGDGRTATFERYPIYDVRAGVYEELWSGWVTLTESSCTGTPQTAVTPTGECVLVEACMPADFTSCRALDGCCDAPLPITRTTR